MSFGGVLARVMACLLLVFSTWNPGGYDYLELIRMPGVSLAEKAVATSVLLVGYVLFGRIAWVALGLPGIAACVAVLVSGTFSLSELDLVDLGDARTRSFLWLGGFALLLATGQLWSLFKRRVAGQSNYLNPPP